MLKNLTLRRKFTVLLTLILLAGLTLSGLVLSNVLSNSARESVASTAQVLMETMGSVREYTNTQITPELQDKIETEFLPQSVPAFSAREVFEILRQNSEYRDFFYKEPTLNPTNLRDKADAFETDLVERFQREPNLKEISGFRTVASEDLFYIARPLIIKEQKCLQCHSTPEAAPKSQIERYGTGGGFGWKLNDVIGARMISVPASKVIDKANRLSLIVLGITSAIFLGVIALVNIMLNRQIIRPLKRMTRVAEEVSTGHTNVEFEQLSNDEIGNLAKAFRRMQLSLEIALKRLNRPTQGGTSSTDF